MVSPKSRYMKMVRLHSLEELDSLPLTKWNIRQHGDDDDDENLEDAMQTGESCYCCYYYFLSFSLCLSLPLFLSSFLIIGSLVTFSF